MQATLPKFFNNMHKLKTTFRVKLEVAIQATLVQESPCFLKGNTFIYQLSKLGDKNYDFFLRYRLTPYLAHFKNVNLFCLISHYV